MARRTEEEWWERVERGVVAARLRRTQERLDVVRSLLDTLEDDLRELEEAAMPRRRMKSTKPAWEVVEEALREGSRRRGPR